MTVIDDDRISSITVNEAFAVIRDALSGERVDCKLLGRLQTLVESAVQANPTCDPDLGWDEFWSIYPCRNGKKVDKKKANIKWRALPLDERRVAYKAAVNYAAACNNGETIAKDAVRFLMNDYYRDWVEGTSKPTGPQRPSWAPANAVWDGRTWLL